MKTAIDLQALGRLSDEELAKLLWQARNINGLPYVATEKQLQFHEHPARGGKEPVLYGGAMGGGKLLNTCTRIPTPSGFVEIGRLQKGDAVLGQDGNQYVVLEAYLPEYTSGWELIFDDGESLIAHDEHLWLTFNRSERVALTRRTPEFREKRRASRKSRVSGNKSEKSSSTFAVLNSTRDYDYQSVPTGTVRTTQEIVASLKTKEGWANHSIPVTEPINLPESELPLDPYLLGLWLGDGTTVCGSVTTMDQEIVDSFVNLGFPVTSIRDKKDNKASTYRFSNLANALRYIHVLGNKHIPHEYLWSSYNQRLALLMGLLDTDGTVTHAGSASFDNTNEDLVRGVAHLARSLGHKAVVKKSREATEKHKEVWSVQFQAHMQVFKLPRKADKLKLASRLTTKHRYIVDAKRVAPQWMRCIRISSPDNLFLAGEGFIPTHNSAALCAEAIRECREVPKNKVLLARKELVVFKRTTLVELLKLLDNIPEQVVHRITEQRFLFPNGSELHYAGLGSEKDREKLKGLELGMLGIDEASEITRDTYQIAAARLRHKPADAAGRLKARLTSNPEPGWLKEDFIDNPIMLRDQETGEVLHDEHGNPLVAYHYIPATIKDNPHVPGTYAADLKQMFADNPAWEKAYLEGNWDAFSGADQVIPSHWIKDAVDYTAPYGFPCVWGLDVARFGDDHSVLVQRRGLKFEIIGRWAKQRIDVTASDVIAKYRDATIKPRTIYVDDTGVGGGVTDILLRAGLPVVGVVVGKQANHPDRFTRLKDEIWWNFRKLMEGSQVDLPPDPELKSSLSAIRYEYMPSTQKIRIEDKQVVKKKIGRSPDEADALVLAAWEGTQSFVLYDSPEGRRIADPATASLTEIDARRKQSIQQLMRALR